MEPLWTETKRLILAAVIFLVVLLAVLHSIPSVEAHYQNTTDPLLKVIDNLIECESGGDVNAINYNDQPDGSHSYGVLQFSEQTWQWANNRYEFDLNIMNPEHQKIIAWQMLNEGRFEHWLICSKSYGYI